MSSVAQRLFLPTMVAVAGMVATQMWYMQATKSTATKTQGEPLAILQNRIEQVERRPTTRLIWQDIGQGDPLFAGEAVRTTSKASGRIHFIKSGLTVGLEPDSVVVIEENSGKVALNLVNGGVFVKNDDDASSGSSKSALQPVIKAGNKTIALSDKKSELALSLSDQGQASLTVTKGNIAVSGANGSEVVKEGSSATLAASAEAPAAINIISPGPNAVIPISAAASTMTISWHPVKVSAVVQLEMGPSRDGLSRKQVASSQSASTLTTTISPGGFFWRLTARSSSGKILAESPTIYNQGLALEPPRLLTPSNGEKISSGSDDSHSVNLSWSRPQSAETIHIQIAKDTLFKEVIETKTFTAESNWTVSLKEFRTYYWRATANWRGMNAQLSSAVYSFNNEAQFELPPPTLEAPTNKAQIVKNTVMENDLVLAWSNVNGASSYIIHIFQQKADGTWQDQKDLNSNTSQFRIKNAPVGVWKWNVQAKTGERLSKSSESFEFKVIDISPLDLSRIANSSQTLDAKNNISMQVGNIPKNTSRVRFRIVEVGKDLTSVAWQQGLKSGMIVTKIKTPGNYQLMVEALDTSERVVASGTASTFAVTLPQALPAPTLAGGTKELKAGGDGKAEIQWNSIKGAVSYVLEFKGGDKSRTYKVNNSKVAIPGLLPGKHSFIVKAMDSFGRSGESSQEFTVVVPDTSNITGPKAKSIKIRD